MDLLHQRNIIWRLLKGMPAALLDDLKQEAWLGALEASAVHHLHPEWGSERATVYRAARWKILNELNRRRLAHLVNEEYWLNAPDRDADARVDAMELLDRLDAEARCVIEMRFWDGLTCAQIGDRIGITGEAARNRLNKALDVMRRNQAWPNSKA